MIPIILLLSCLCPGPVVRAQTDKLFVLGKDTLRVSTNTDSITLKTGNPHFYIGRGTHIAESNTTRGVPLFFVGRMFGSFYRVSAGGYFGPQLDSLWFTHSFKTNGSFGFDFRKLHGQSLNLKTPGETRFCAFGFYEFNDEILTKSYKGTEYITFENVGFALTMKKYYLIVDLASLLSDSPRMAVLTLDYTSRSSKWTYPEK